MRMSFGWSGFVGSGDCLRFDNTILFLCTANAQTYEVSKIWSSQNRSALSKLSAPKPGEDSEIRTG